MSAFIKTLLVLLFVSAIYSAKGADVTWNFADFTVTPLGQRRVEIYPASLSASGVWTLTGDRLVYTNLSNGTLLVTNMAGPMLYLVHFFGPYKETVITNLIPSTTNAINANQYIVVDTNFAGIVAYSTLSADALFVHTTNGGAINLTVTNAATVLGNLGVSTNASITNDLTVGGTSTLWGMTVAGTAITAKTHIFTDLDGVFAFGSPTFRYAENYSYIFYGKGTSPSSPIFSRDADSNTGVYFPGPDRVAFTTGGSSRLEANNNGIVLATSSAPSSPANGAIWNDTIQKALQAYTAGTTNSIPGVLFTPTASKTITNTLAETSIIPTSGIGPIGLAKSFPENFWTPGKTVYMEFWGTYNAADSATPEFTLKGKIAGNTLDTGVMGISADANAYVRFQFIITCYTTGVSGTFTANIYSQSTTWAYTASSFNELIVDTTSPTTFDITVTPTETTTAFRTQNGFIEVKN